ncbi:MULTISPECIES: hypothetical protein [unclassified Streptomyces]|uniref:hypothetical protein n=1 Tax=unclassified Streptomyces TaxID=2593676 RepID=UPI003660B87D
MTTILNYLVVLAVAALLAGPALYGIARERRIDRQLHEAAAGRSRAEVRKTQKSSSRSTVPSTATW